MSILDVMAQRLSCSAKDLARRLHASVPLPFAASKPPVAASGIANVADHWNNWENRQQASANAGNQWVDWGDHPYILSRLQEIVFGNPDEDVLAYLRRRLPELASAHVLSPCCGNASFEKTLLSSGTVGSVVGMDIACTRLQSGMSGDREQVPGRLELRQGDVNLGDFGENAFDAVFAKAALHHVIDLEKFFDGIDQALKKDGLLVAIDSFGPARFQWSDRQLELANRFLEEHVPPALKMLDGGQAYAARRPTVEEMILLDPSEAARSNELIGFIRRHFRRVEIIPIGGTLLNLIFPGAIINNFSGADESHRAIIDAAIDLEQAALKSGEITSDFAIVIAHQQEG